MLNTFDWLRRCHSGAELLATLEYSQVDTYLLPPEEEIGPPLSAFERPCPRCWIYPGLKPEALSPKFRDNAKHGYCRSCLAITNRSKALGNVSRVCVVIWGCVSHVPDQLLTRDGFYADKAIGSYIHDEHRFLLLIHRRELKTWIQELLIYHGSDMRGLFHIFPTTGGGQRGSMGEILCGAIYHESRFPMDMLRVRFFSNPFQVFSPGDRDEKGLLTFEAAEFLRLLEMTEIFRSFLRPEEQKALHELVRLKNRKEEQFYWGRFMGYLSQQAKDMLNAWKIRQWPKNRIRLLYELTDYVHYHQNGVKKCQYA